MIDVALGFAAGIIVACIGCYMIARIKIDEANMAWMEEHLKAKAAMRDRRNAEAARDYAVAALDSFVKET